jgi:hypothetical protein
MRILFVLMLAFACGGANAQWIDPDTKKPMPDLEWRKTVEGLGGMLIVTRDYERMMKEWTDGQTEAPSILPASGAKRGDSLTAVVFFSGCADPGQNCELFVDFTVLKPDGSTYGKIPNIAAFNAVVPKANVVMITKATMRLKIESNDPLGEYTILAKVRQPKKNRSMELKQRLFVE